MMWYIVLKLIKHARVITMNTRLSTGILTFFSLILRSSVSSRLMQLFFCSRFVHVGEVVRL
jgi:hypothetical protein